MRLSPAAAPSLLLIALAASTLSAAGSEPVELPEGEPWRHEPSGIQFPPDIGTFTRVSATRYDDEARNVSIGYNDRALRVLITVYVYPNLGLPLGQHFEQVKRDVRQVHPEARVVSEGDWKLEQDGRKFTGRRATFSFRVAIRGQEHEVVSEACLLRLGEYFIKFRVTCPKQRHEAAADRVGRFLQSLKMPGPAATTSER